MGNASGDKDDPLHNDKRAHATACKRCEEAGKESHLEKRIMKKLTVCHRVFWGKGDDKYQRRSVHKSLWDDKG